MSAREELYAALMAGGPHSPDRSAKASGLIDGLRDEVWREAQAALNEAEEELTGARLACWEEEQDNRRLRLALASAQRRARRLRARVAELEKQTDAARTEAIADVGDWLDEIGQKDAAHLVYTCDIPAARDMKTVPQQDDTEADPFAESLARDGFDQDEIAEILNRPTTAPADFFQPGRTYQRRRWHFQCLAVAPNPFNGETRAVGYLYRPGEPATATALDPDDWAHGEWAAADGSGEPR